MDCSRVPVAGSICDRGCPRCVVIALAVAVALASIYLFVSFLSLLDRGFDVTDESHSTLWIQGPARYTMSLTFFGYPLNALYRLCAGDIVLLRRVAALALAAAAGSAFLALAAPLRATSPSDKTALVALTATAVLAQVAYYFYWRPTPSYNWLITFAALGMLAALGLMLRGRWHASMVVAVVSGVLALLTKPPSAVIICGLYVLSAMVALPDWKARAAKLVSMGIVSLAVLGIAALLLPVGHIWQQGVVYTNNIANSILGEVDLGYRLRQLLLSPEGSVLTAAVSLSLAQAFVPPARAGLRQALAAFVVAALPVMLWLALDRLALHVAGLLASVYAIAIISCTAGLLDDPRARRHHVALLAGVLIAWGSAFATSNILAHQVTIHAGVVAVVALAALWHMPHSRAVAALAGALPLVYMGHAAITYMTAHPYRSATPLTEQTEPTRLPIGLLRLDMRTKAFFESIAGQAEARGFRPGIPILDFSGELPGLAVALGTTPPVMPWLIGGYPNSPAFARWVSGQIPAVERRGVWVSYMEGERRIPMSVVRELGFDLEHDYELAAEAEHPIHRIPVRVYAPRR